MTANQTTSWRVLVGAGSFADARAALQLVERFAGPHLAELGGVFLEEARLSEIADLPMQRVVTPGGMLTGAPSRQQIVRLLERDAAAFRKMLSGVAQTRKWAFERRRGELIGSLCEAAEGWDMLFVGHSVLHRSAGRVVLIAPPPQASQRATDLAGEIAHALGTGVHTLSLTPGQGAARPDQTVPECFEDAGALLSRLSRIPAVALVVDLAAGPFHGVDDLRRLHAAARCPIIVFGAGRRETEQPAGGID